ncbi:MAG: N-formylglutamate amidohydrolase [Hyphomicrobiaceae bacterium]
MSARERSAILAELSPPFIVHHPAEALHPFVFSSPHSGRVYPKAFLEDSRLPAATLRKSEDAFVEELFLDVPSLGAPLIAARFPRAYLDVNREPYELDPDLFVERLPDFANTRSLRVVGGLGTIARVVAESEEIYRRRLTVEAAFERINRLYKPYHAELAKLLATARRTFGIAILIDCHSMPSVGTGQPGQRPHFVIGDRFGSSCHPSLTRLLQRELLKLGYEVALNRPYAGGFITEHYGNPSLGVHALQIEVNRSLYMNEETFETTPGFHRIVRDLKSLIERIMVESASLVSTRTAAE